MILVLVIGVVALIYLAPRISGAFGSITSSSGGGGSGSKTSIQSSNGNDNNIDVSGNGCACSNGVCKGNCADMEDIDLENFDPFDWVSQRT